jgi:hypothetical protein
MQRGTELPIRAGVDGLDAGCRLTLELGHTRVADEDRFARLVERTRGVSGPTPPRVPSVGPAQLDEALGATFDLLAGSGLSYESGVPMLKWVHDLFRVDDGDRGFCLGSADRFPIDLSEDLEATVASFATWQLLAGAASPSPAHRAILDLRRSGRLDRIFTDNVDRLLPACGVEDSVNVRGSGVVNEVFPAHFGSNSRALLVVGVSADRRGVIAQARRRGMRIVVVNPYLPVSPGARNLDYLQSGDVYGRATAGELLPKLSR